MFVCLGFFASQEAVMTQKKKRKAHVSIFARFAAHLPGGLEELFDGDGAADCDNEDREGSCNTPDKMARTHTPISTVVDPVVTVALTRAQQYLG